MSFDPRLYLVTDPRYAFEPLLPGLFEAGVTLLQIRDKRATDDDLARVVDRALEAAAPHGVPVLVNDRIEVARRTGAAGVHLGRTDGSVEAARQALGPDAIVGWSVETLDHELPDAASYVAASPVYVTPTKTDTAPALGLEGVRGLRRRTTVPIVGIGGIDVARADAVVRAGARGVAVVSAILGAPDPVASARALRAAVDRARGENDGVDPARLP